VPNVDRKHPHGPGGPPAVGDAPSSRPEPGLGEAAGAWLAARAELVGIEAREAAGTALKRGLLAGLFGGLALFAWGLFVAGLIGGISAGTGLAWYWVAAIFAVVHAAGAVAAGMALKRPGTPMFEMTRNELGKDQLWLEDLRRRIK